MKPTESLLPDREEAQCRVISTVTEGNQEVVRTQMRFQPDLVGRGWGGAGEERHSMDGKACRTNPPGSRERSWQREQQGQRFKGIKGKPRKALGWSTGCRGWGLWGVETDSQRGQLEIEPKWP